MEPVPSDLHSWSFLGHRSCFNRALTILTLTSLVVLVGCSGGSSKRREAALSQTPPLALQKAQNAFDAGDIQRAQVLFSTIESPAQPLTNRGLARLGLGRCALKLGDPDQASTHLELARKLLTSGSDQARVLFYLGEAQLRLGAINSGLNQLEKAYRSLTSFDEKNRAAFLITRTLDHLGEPVSALYRNASQENSYPEYASIWIRETPTASVTAAAEIKPTSVARMTTIKKAAPPMRLQKRSSWNAKPVRRNSVVAMTQPFRITVHNTADQPSIEKLGEQSPAHYLRRIQEYCVKNLQWGDIGYHYLISSDGRIWEGRSMKYQGAHAGNNALNRGNIGVALIGNFDKNQPSSQQLDSLRTLLGSLCQIHDISPGSIAGHRELRETTCPGRHLQAALNRMIRDLAQSPARNRAR
ncbi:MAG: N-acetylmuramoyl-L-alanine amidase [Planctomycetota bacterium]